MVEVKLGRAIVMLVFLISLFNLITVSLFIRLPSHLILYIVIPKSATENSLVGLINSNDLSLPGVIIFVVLVHELKIQYVVSDLDEFLLSDESLFDHLAILWAILFPFVDIVVTQFLLPKPLWGNVLFSLWGWFVSFCWVFIGVLFS